MSVNCWRCLILFPPTPPHCCAVVAAPADLLRQGRSEILAESRREQASVQPLT